MNEKQGEICPAAKKNKCLIFLDMFWFFDT